MDKRILDLLEQHADALVRGQAVDLEQLASDPSLAANVRPLAALAEQCKAALTPVAPSEAFRTRLKQGLEMAQRHAANPLVIEPPVAVRHWWVGAAAVGSALAAGGIIALAMRSRQKAGKLQLPLSV